MPGKARPPSSSLAETLNQSRTSSSIGTRLWGCVPAHGNHAVGIHVRLLQCALALAVLLSAPAPAQDLAVPRQHQKLYDALEGQVSAFGRGLPLPQADTPLLRGAPLRALLGCSTPGELLSSSRWAEAQRELDALRRIGTQVLVVDVCYPLLTPAFHDPRLVLERLANLANEARLRQLRVLVRHASLPPAQALAEGRWHYRGLSRARFFQERAEEVKSLVIAMQPDYLTLVSDPRAHSAGLALQARDWRIYVDATATRLHQDLGDLVPPLGAGSAVSDTPVFAEAFAGIRSLSYIDLRFYRSRNGQEQLLDRLITWPRRIRTIDPDKRIVFSEVWLSKATAEETAQLAYDGAPAARASYGFWSPLDVAFLRTVARAARTQQVELIAVSRPDLLFSYVDFFDPLLFRANARQVIESAAQRAAAAREQGGLSDTGRAFGAL